MDGRLKEQKYSSLSPHSTDLITITWDVAEKQQVSNIWFHYLTVQIIYTFLQVYTLIKLLSWQSFHRTSIKGRFQQRNQLSFCLFLEWLWICSPDQIQLKDGISLRGVNDYNIQPNLNQCI